MHPVIEEIAEKIKVEIIETLADRLDAVAAEREKVDAAIKTNEEDLETCRNQIRDLESKQASPGTQLEDLNRKVESLESEVLPSLRRAKEDKIHMIGTIISGVLRHVAMSDGWKT